MKKKFLYLLLGFALIATSGFIFHRSIKYTIWTSCGLGLSFTSDGDFSDDELYEMYFYLESELCPPSETVYYVNKEQCSHEQNELLAVA